MRIVYHHRIASKDGQYVHLEELVAAFKRAGHEIVMVGPTIVDSSDFGSEGGIISSIKKVLPKFAYELLELLYSFFAYFRLRRAVRRYAPDIIYERYNLLSPAGVWVSRQLRVPLVLEVNAPLYEERSKYDGISLRRLARWSQEYTWRNADALLPVTAVLAAMIREAGAEADRVTVIPNGVVLERFEDLPERDVAKRALGLDDGITFGFVGFIREWHRLDMVIDAMAYRELSDARLVVVGDGPARVQLEKLAESRNLQDRVVFTGLVQRSDLLPKMAAFDVALQPHVVSYASPLKLFEYMAMRLPIVAPDTANIREVLTHDQSALLVKLGDAHAMSEVLMRLATNKNLRDSLGESARHRLETGKFSWDSNAAEIEKIASSISCKNE